MKFFIILLGLIGNLYADVIKPTLVEVSIFENKVELQFLLNLEAVLTNIGTQYKNTTEAPNSNEYDELRALSPIDLEQKFNVFEAQFLQNIVFLINDKKPNLVRKSLEISEVGYTKRSRKSLIVYQIKFNKDVNNITWQYYKKYGNNAIRVRFYEKNQYTWQKWHWLRPAERLTENVAQYKPLTTIESIIKFITIGFYHVISLGLDHILFIIAMALGVVKFRKLLILVSSFTLAHTLTLGLATFEVVQVNSNIIEPIIATTIVFMAIEKLLFKIKQMTQVIVVFIFGLLHGLGFASMLKSFIDKDFVGPLIGFNLGVEFAQIFIVMIMLFIFLLSNKLKINDKFVVYPIATIIIIVGIWMLLNRI